MSWKVLETVLSHVKAGVHMKAVFWLGIMFLMQTSRLRFKQSRISRQLWTTLGNFRQL